LRAKSKKTSISAIPYQVSEPGIREHVKFADAVRDIWSQSLPIREIASALLQLAAVNAIDKHQTRHRASRAWPSELAGKRTSAPPSPAIAALLEVSSCELLWHIHMSSKVARSTYATDFVE
jgi:hypothetical protein